MVNAQVIHGEIRTTEDGRTVIMVNLADRTLAFPVELDEEGYAKSITGCIAEEGLDAAGTPTLKLHIPCLSVVGQPESANAGGLTLLEGDGTDG